MHYILIALIGIGIYNVLGTILHILVVHSSQQTLEDYEFDFFWTIGLFGMLLSMAIIGCVVIIQNIISKFRKKEDKEKDG